MKAKHAIAATLAALMLAGCGGGSGGGSGSDDGLTQQQREDRDASATVAGLIAFAQALIAGTSDGTEARSVTGINPPVDDTSEASPL